MPLGEEPSPARSIYSLDGRYQVYDWRLALVVTLHKPAIYGVQHRRPWGEIEWYIIPQRAVWGKRNSSSHASRFYVFVGNSRMLKSLSGPVAIDPTCRNDSSQVADVRDVVNCRHSGHGYSPVL